VTSYAEGLSYFVAQPSNRETRDPRQSRLAQGKGSVTGDPSRWGARPLFLPKNSPDLNPIEQVFAKFKTLLRKAAARTYDAISDASKTILAQYLPEECAAYLKNAGYA
jgi:transposase